MKNTDNINANPFKHLSKREKQVIICLANNMSVKEAAEHMGISVKTVYQLKYRARKKYNFKTDLEMFKFVEKYK